MEGFWMKKIDVEEFNRLLKEDGFIRPKLKRELKFNNSVAGLTDEEWELSEMIPIFDRAGNHGVLLVEVVPEERYIIPFDLTVGLAGSDGRTKPVICDFCRTWRPGSQAGSISFPRDKRSVNSVGFLCCGDLKCSMNVRDRTDAARRSRTQVREDITVEGRVARLRGKIVEVMAELGKGVVD
jgi:hypothetical protein